MLDDWRFEGITNIAASELDELLPGAPTPSFPYLVRASGPEVYLIDAPPPLGGELVDYEGPVALSPGGAATITIRFKNRGSMTWEPGVVGLAPVEPRDHDSALCDALSWSSCKRAAWVEATTKPGEVGVFRFAIRAPATEGVVRECWALHARSPGGTEHWSGDLGQLGPDDKALCRDVIVSADAADAGVSDGSKANADNADEVVGSCACRMSHRAAGNGLALIAAGALLLLRRRR